MPPKPGLLGTLSSIALGVGLSVSGGGHAHAQTSETDQICLLDPDLGVVEQLSQLPQDDPCVVCEWVAQTTSIEALQRRIDDLAASDPQATCIAVAAARIAELTATTAPPGPVALN